MSFKGNQCNLLLFWRALEICGESFEQWAVWDFKRFFSKNICFIVKLLLAVKVFLCVSLLIFGKQVFILNSFHFKIRFIISLKFVVSHVSVLTEADAAQSPGDVWMWDWDGVFNYIPTLSPQLAPSHTNSTQTPLFSSEQSSRIKGLG